MMRCSQIRRLRERGFLETLTLDEEFLIEEHAAGCPSCAQVLEREERFDRALQDLPDAPVERLDVARSMSAIWDQVDAVYAVEPRGARPVRRVIALAAALVLLVSLVAIWRNAEQPSLVAEALVVQEPVEADIVRVDGPPSTPDVAQPAPAVPTSSNVLTLEAATLDRSRLGRARAEVREQLAAAAASLDLDTPRADVIEQLDGTLARSLGSWPVLRIIEGQARDTDPLVARVALRYLGLRGDATSVRVIERALRDEELAPAAVEALCDRGDGGLAGLTWAYWHTPHGERVREHILQLAPMDRASNRACLAWARATVRAAGDAIPAERGGVLLALLGDIEDQRAPQGAGADGIEYLFVLVSDPRWNTLALDALAERGGTSEYLARALTDDGSGHTESVRLDVIQRLGSAAALPWLEVTCRRGEQPERALEVLAGMDGVEVIESLIYVRREFSAERFAAAWRKAIEHDSERFSEYAWQTVERGGRAEHVTYLDLLLAHEPARVVPAICALGSSSMLADDDRERALLIAGELGGGEDLAVLRTVFDALEHDELNLAAACLWSARRLGGLVDDASASSWLGASSVKKRRRVLDLLPQGTPPSDATLRRFRLARELEAILSTRDESDRFARGARYNSSEGTTP
ncbi:MAG: hypothetical protein ACI8QZ_000617 [Chlamydiales bacterium]|jgi:hypothetical protein